MFDFRLRQGASIFAPLHRVGRTDDKISEAYAIHRNVVNTRAGAWVSVARMMLPSRPPESMAGTPWETFPIENGRLIE